MSKKKFSVYFANVLKIQNVPQLNYSEESIFSPLFTACCFVLMTGREQKLRWLRLRGRSQHLARLGVGWL